MQNSVPMLGLVGSLDFAANLGVAGKPEWDMREEKLGCLLLGCMCPPGRGCGEGVGLGDCHNLRACTMVCPLLGFTREML